MQAVTEISGLSKHHNRAKSCIDNSKEIKLAKQKEKAFSQKDGDFILTFIQENTRLIEKEARHRFGRFYDIEEVQSVAFIAAHKAMCKMKFEYRNRTLKFSSCFEWYFRKEMNRLKDVGCSSEKGGTTTVDQSEGEEYDNEIDHDYGDSLLNDDRFASDDTDDGSGAKRSSYYTRGGNKCGFIIDLDALLYVRMPSHITKSLKLISKVKYTGNVKQTIGCRKIGAATAKLWKSIRVECDKKNVSAYVGLCLNGSLNRVLTFASDHDQAALRLKKYGDVLELGIVGSS